MIERSGIPAVSITLLREITEKVQPPRALFVNRPLGYPLGAPNDPKLQTRIMLQAFGMLQQRPESAVIDSFE